MRSCLVVTLCLSLALLLARQEGHSQAKTLDAQAFAENAHTAWVAGDYEKVYGMLSASVRGKIGLQNLAMRREVGAMNLDDKTLVAAFMDGFRVLDPKNRLDLDHPRKLLTLSDKQFFGLASGLLGVSHNLGDDKWYLTELVEGTLFGSSSGRNVFRTGASARFETVGGTVFELLVVPEEGLKVEYYGIFEDSYRVDLRGFLHDGANYDVRWHGVLEQRERVGFGERLLVQARAFCTGMYPRENDETALKEAFERHLADESEPFQNIYYAVTTLHVRLAVDGFNAGLSAKPKHVGDPWLLVVFDWNETKARRHKFNDEAALLKKVEELR